MKGHISDTKAHWSQIVKTDIIKMEEFDILQEFHNVTQAAKEQMLLEKWHP